LLKDERKSLFCKIDKDKKDKLEQMLEYYHTTIGDLIGMMIEIHYDNFIEQKKNIISSIANTYSGVIR
jgi:hypothetical protein